MPDRTPFFVPADAALEKPPKGILENWLKSESKAKLRSVLKHHILTALTSAAEVEKLTATKMMEGLNVAIKKDDNSLSIGGALIIQPDIASNNDVIHAIDTVFLPAKYQFL